MDSNCAIKCFVETEKSIIMQDESNIQIVENLLQDSLKCSQNDVNMLNYSDSYISTEDNGRLKRITKDKQITLPKLERFSEWVHCMCIVTFDLEIGQAIEEIYPKKAFISEQERMNICYLAFPDSNSSCIGDTQYHIRLRLSPDNIDSIPLNSIQKIFSNQSIYVQKPDLGHYWGFVFFRQKKDKSIPRGYFQKSFILLTRLPFFNLFNEIVSAVAPRYFNDGKKILQIVYDQINNWPSLQAGESYTLNLLGTVYQTIIPKSNSKTHNSSDANKTRTYIMKSEVFGESSSANLYDKEKLENLKEFSNVLKEDACKKRNSFKFVGPTLPPQVLTSVHEIDIFRSMSICIPNIYTLWELVLLAEPIVIMGSSPSDVSHMVQSLISLIFPLSYLAESRPYFTIHDSEFKEFTVSSSKLSDTCYNRNIFGLGNSDHANKFQSLPQQIILGVTNPFFGKLLQHWPNMIKLPDSSQQLYSIIPTFSIMNNNISNNDTDRKSNSLKKYTHLSTINMKNPQLLTRSNINYSGSNNNNHLLNLVTANTDSNNPPGLYSKYKPLLKKDKILIKKIQLGVKTKRPDQVQSALLRRHFLELTQSFMIPLERYMATLMPLLKDISPFKAAPNPNEFNQNEFLATLDQSGPQLTSSLKGNWKGLYKKFFKSPNFKGWYENRYKELESTLQKLQLQVLSDADLCQWAQGKQEVEIIDMILKLKQKIKFCTEPQEITKSFPTRSQLEKQIDHITQSLPDDLKLIIQKST